MIPQIVHQLWIDPGHTNTGQAQIPDDIRRNIATWDAHHPDIAHHEWTLDDLRHILQDFDGMDIWGAMQVCRFPTMQANLVRLVLILKFGGFWSDPYHPSIYPHLPELVYFGKARERPPDGAQACPEEGTQGSSSFPDPLFSPRCATGCSSFAPVETARYTAIAGTGMSRSSRSGFLIRLRVMPKPRVLKSGNIASMLRRTHSREPCIRTGLRSWR